MTPKEKYQDIDASASVLPEKAIINLQQLKPILFDKKYQTEEYSDTRKKAEEKMNAMYDKIAKDYPDAIKSKVAKQPEPKTPQAMAQKAAKQTIKQPTVKNPKATAGATKRGNVTKLAKEIRKDGETWHAAMKRAGEMINKEKGKAVKKANVQYEKLKAFLAKNPSIEKTMVTYGKKPNQGTRPLDVKRDAARVAKPKGKRVSSEGKTYYEYRANRTDSSRKRYPYLELGGKLFGAGHFAKGGEFGHTFNGAGKFAEGGYLPKGANYQSYTPQGEDYEYRNFFGIEQGDFEKIVDVWHQDENNHAKYGNVYDKTISDMEAKYGFDKIDAVISHIEDVHNLHKMYHEDYFAKGGKIDVTIDEVRENGEFMDSYMIDESQTVSNAGEQESWLYKGKNYLITVWNNRAEEHYDGQEEIAIDEDYGSYAKGGNTNKGDNLPNTVEEYFAAMNNFSMRLGEAEANFVNDNGASYQRVLAERDEFFEKVKAKWYAELNEAEGNFAKDGGKSYEAALKKLDDARLRFAKGGKISDVKWSNDENKRLGIWLLTSVDGNKILKMSSNGMELEKNVMDYYNKKGSVAKMTYNEDADEGLAWVTFSDLYQEVQSVYAKGGTTKGHTKYVVRQDIIDAGESVPVGNTYVSSGVYEGRYNDDGSFEIKHNGKWHEAESIDWETYAKGGFIDLTKNKNKAAFTADFNNEFWVLETIFREKHNYLSGISQYLGIEKSLVKEKLDALVKKGWVRVEENTAKPHLNQYYVTEKGKNEYSKDKYWSYDIIKNKVERYTNGELVDIVDVYGFNIYMNGAFRNMNGIYYDSRKEATQRAKEIIKLLQDVNYKEPRNFGLFAKGGEITPKVNSQIVERAKIIYADNNGSTKEDFDMAYHQAIREAGYNVEEFISTMKNIGADYGHEGDDYYAKGGKVKGRLSDTHKYVPNRMIQEIEVERRGKTSFIDGADILDGVYVKKGVKFAHGGSMPHVHSKKHRNG